VKPPGILKKRIPALVCSGFALLLVLGLATSLFLLLRLRSTIRESEAFAAATSQVRAAVRDLYADSIDQELNRVLLSPQAGAEITKQKARMRASDDHEGRLLRMALSSTHSEPLRRVLTELQDHDRAVATPRAEDVLALARKDLVAARALYLTRYLPAQARNLELVKEAKGLATEEVAALAARSQAEAERAQFWSRLAIGWHLHFNQRWMDYTGLTLEESLGHGWLPPFHPEDQPRAAKRWQRANESGEPYEIEYRLRAADGTYRWMLGHASPLRDATGAIVKWFRTCTNIDGLKMAELEVARTNREVIESQRLAESVTREIAVANQALIESQRFAESIAENSTSFIYLHDLETGRNVYSNHNLAEFLGHSPAETRRIRAAEQTAGQHTPIVTMTAHAMAGDRDRCLADGMDDYLSMPLQKTALLALIERIAGAAVPKLRPTDNSAAMPRTRHPNPPRPRQPAPRPDRRPEPPSWTFSPNSSPPTASCPTAIATSGRPA